MLTYIVVLVAVVAVLYASFRALSGAGPLTAADCRSALARVAGLVEARAAELDAALVEVPLVSTAEVPEAGHHDPLPEAAGAARKQLAGYQQQLTHLEPDPGVADREVLRSARSLLSAAVEDYGWACRMLEAGAYRDNVGVRRAVAALREHGAECLRAALRLVEA